MRQRPLRALARSKSRSLECEHEAELRVAIEFGIGARDELVRLGFTRLRTCLGTLRERVDGHRTHDREQNRAGDDDGKELTMSAI